MPKANDMVAVHPKWGTIHEIHSKHRLACGNPYGLIDYKRMRRSTAEGKPNARQCMSAACVKARKD